MAESEIVYTPEGRRSEPEWSGTASLITPEPWMQDALCAEVDPDMFFPNRGDAEGADLARDICSRCPVKAECLEFAIRTTQAHGVWGGKSPRQIADIRAKRKRDEIQRGERAA